MKFVISHAKNSSDKCRERVLVVWRFEEDGKGQGLQWYSSLLAGVIYFVSVESSKTPSQDKKTVEGLRTLDRVRRREKLDDSAYVNIALTASFRPLENTVQIRWTGKNIPYPSYALLLSVSIDS